MNYFINAYVGISGNYSAIQASTSGSGFGALFTVSVDGSGNVDAVISVDSGGAGYEVDDTVTVSLIGITEVSAAVLKVDSIT